MSLNVQKGNMYSDITHTWNPLIGECPHRCSYCSTNKLKERFPVLRDRYSGELRLDESCLSDNLGSGRTIFVCAQNDLFAKIVCDVMIIKILNHCCKYPDNTYYFQTKRPHGLYRWSRYFPHRSVFLTTLETNRRDLLEKYSGGDKSTRVKYFHCVDGEKILTIEPVMKFDIEEFVDQILFTGAKKVYIGADSGNNNLPEPSADELLLLIKKIKDNGIEVVCKSNLNRLLRR